MAPDPSELPETDRLDDLYIASIDPVIGSQDAIALPNAPAQPDDLVPPTLSPPVPLGTTFDFDERGFVRATPDGALTPEGVVVYEGRPPVAAPPRPADLQVPEQDTRLAPEVDRFQLIRPPLRPGNLAEGNERARLGGFSAVELAAIRPNIRPVSFQQPETAAPARGESAVVAIAEPPAPEQDPVLDDATELAVTASRTPATRPSGFASLVEKALKEANPPAKPAARTPKPEADDEPEPSVAAAQMPPVPSRASVAKQATVVNAINLGKVNLIGVYGSPSQRRALVRLPSGRYIKVKVGDKVDGGQVAAIGDTELRYIKMGRNITLTLPKG
jgi:biotin carboxyl carrier protein